MSRFQAFHGERRARLGIYHLIGQISLGAP